MKNIWIKVSYYWFIFMLVIVGFLCGGLNVNASTTNWSRVQTRYWFDDHGIPTNNGSWQAYPQTWSPTLPVLRVQFRLTIPETFKADSTYTFKVGWASTPDSLGVQTVYANFANDEPTYSNISCGNFTYDDSGYNIATCTVSPNTDIASGSYFYVAIHFYGSYVNSLKSYIKGYTSQLGTNAVIENQTNKINDSIEDIEDTITDSNVDSPNDSLEDMQDMLPSNSTITSLIALPITLYQKVVNSVNGTCSSMNLGALYGTNLIMPCIEISDYLGNTLWNTIDLIISGIFVLTIARKMIKAFNNFTFMKEGDVIND